MKVASICFILGWLLAGDPAWGTDWGEQACTARKDFCRANPYHLDCRPLSWNLPLTVMVDCTPPLPEACKQQPWHISCGRPVPVICRKEC